MDWFGFNKSPYVDGTDANFGVLARDEQIAEEIVRTKERWGQPEKFRTSYAKYSNPQIAERIFRIAKVLNHSGQIKAVTLALQSMNEGTLVDIKRKNIAMDKFRDFIKRYDAEGIPTYTELILGLPSETLESFIDGINRNLDAGQHSGLFIYLNIMLANTDQSDPEYIKQHGLRTIPMQAMLSHGIPDPDTVPEIQGTVVETATMPHADWRRAWLFSKTVEVFHGQGLLQLTAINAREALGIRYRDFYGRLVDWLLSNLDTVASREMIGIQGVLDRALAGGSWDCVDPRLGAISWPPEEFAFARICLQLDSFYNEIEGFCQGIPCELLRDVDGPEPGMEEEWATQVVWYGRKGKGSKLGKKELAS